MNNTAIHRIWDVKGGLKNHGGAGTPDRQGVVVDCWNQIGVSGDGSCPELKSCFHCRNCSVFSSSGRSLFDRGIEAEYKAELTELLSKEKIAVDNGTVALFAFRLSDEWLTIPTALFIEVAEVKTIRRMPYRPNPVFKGMVNIRGELQLCVSLHPLLGLTEPPAGPTQRWVVIEKDRARWVFPVDEALGLIRCSPANLEKTPVTIAKAASPHIKAILRQKQGLEIQGLSAALAAENSDSKAWQAGVLDEELLFYQLGRSVQ